MEKRYGLPTAIAMVIGIVIGSGVFIKGGKVLSLTGGNMLQAVLVVAIVGLMCIICSLVFAELATRYEKVNGVVDYAEMALGPNYAYFMGWFTTTIYYPSLAATLAFFAAVFTCPLFGVKALDFSSRIISMETVGLGAGYLMIGYGINALSPKLAGKLQVSMTVIKLIPLILMGIVGTIAGISNGSTAAVLLRRYRAEQVDFLEDSFETIAAYGPHAAVVHYAPTPETDVPLKAQGLLLVDSGGHYARGTTDVTRTIALGPITDEERRRSTQVLQGHIQLAMAQFPQGVMGENLDALARGPLWREGLDYDHGTGHGVGCVLSVHEAPPSFRWRIAEGLAHPALETGMVISDEPGYYAAGRFGIRHENLLLVQPAEAAGFLRFETLTLAPFDRDALDPALLTASERDWLNGYHRRVYAQIAPLVPTEVRQWLREVTAAL